MSTLRVNEIGARTGNVVSMESGTQLFLPGSVVQVVYATSGFVNQTINSTTPVALTGMAATITPRYASSRIVVQAMVTASWTYVSSVHVFRNGVNVTPAHGSNSQSGGTNALWTHYAAAFDLSADKIMPFPVMYSEAPNTTSPLEYSIRANSGWSGGSNAFYFNNRATPDMLSSSNMLVMEIAQ